MAEHKRRARWRLLGAVILAAAVAALAPVLLEEEARPLSQDLLIEIPSKDSLFAKIESLKPPPEPATATEPTTPVPEPVVPPSAPAVSSETVPAKSELKADAKQKADQKEESKPEPKPKPEAKPETKPDGRFLVQVGAYAKIEAANAVKAKLTAGGHSVAIETIKTAEGAERHRVRIGPFATKDLATQVRDRAKAQGYDAAVIGP
jgi:DedD protein